MTIGEEFDEWARDGKDRGMEQRHWHTAREALALVPIEPGDIVVDLGTGSGYALRALRNATAVRRCYGIDASGEMLRNARSYSIDPSIGLLGGDFGALPFLSNSIDHVFSMEAFYYASDPLETLAEIRRILDTGGTFYCAVDYFEENVHSHHWADLVDVEMTLWSSQEYRDAFHEAGLLVGAQRMIPDRETEIPPASEFPTDEWDTREAMVERFRTFGTLLTVGVVPD